MNRVAVAVILAALFVAPALLTIAPAVAGFTGVIAQAVAAGSAVYIQPTNKTFYIDPNQTVIFTVTSSTNAFANNAQLEYTLVDAGENPVLATWYTWVTPVNVYEDGVTGRSIRGPSATLDPLLPPIAFISKNDFTGLAVDNDYGIVVSDDGGASYTDAAFFRLTDVLADPVKDAPLLVPKDAAQYYQDYVDALTLGTTTFSNLQPEDVQITISSTGTITFVGAIGDYIPVYRPGDEATFIAEFPDPVEGQNVTVYLYLDQVDNSPEARITGYGPANKEASITIPSQIPMGLHVVIAVADYGDHYLTAATFIYVVPKVVFNPFLISADPGASLSATITGLPMNATVDFFLAYNQIVGSANTYVFDIAGAADTVSANDYGSVTATFELLGTGTDDATYTPGGIDNNDLGALTADFTTGVQQLAGATLPAGVTNYLIFQAAIVASRPSIATDPATWGQEGLVLTSVKNVSTTLDAVTIAGLLGAGTPVPVNSDYSIVRLAVFNLPANLPLKVYMGLKASEAPEAHQLVPVASARTSSYGSAVIEFQVPELPSTGGTPYMIVVETQSQPSLLAIYGSYGGTQSPALVEVVPAVVDQAMGTEGFAFNFAGNWYIAEGVKIYFKVTGLEPYSYYAVIQDNLAVAGIEFVGLVRTNAYGTAEFFVSAIGDPNGVTGNDVQVIVSGVGIVFTYKTVGPILVTNMTVPPGSGSIVRSDAAGTIFIGEGRLGLAGTPDSVEITIENLVPGAEYVLCIKNSAGTTVYSMPFTSTTGTTTITIEFTDDVFPGYGLYMVKAKDAQTGTIRLATHVLLVATTTAPGSTPGAGIAAYSLATGTAGYSVDVPAGARSGLLIVGWNFSSTETLKVGLQGRGEANVPTYPGSGLYGIDSLGVVVVDAISQVLGGTVQLEAPAGTYAAYIKREYASAVNATQMWVNYNVYPTVEIIASDLVSKTVTTYDYEGGVIIISSTEVTLASVGAQIEFRVYGLNPSTHYYAMITDVNGVPLTIRASAVSSEYGTLEFSAAAGTQITLPSYLQVKNQYRIALAPAFNVFGGITFVDSIAPMNLASTILSRSIILLEKNAIELTATDVTIGQWLGDWIDRAGSLADATDASLTQWFVSLDNVGFFADQPTPGAAANETIEITVLGFNNLAADTAVWKDGVTPDTAFNYGDVRVLNNVLQATVKLTVAGFEDVVYILEVPATVKITMENIGTATTPDYEYVAYIRFKMPSLPEEILNLDAPYRVFGVEFKLFADYYYNDGTNQNEIQVESEWIPVGGFAILVGSGSLLPVNEILGKLSNIEAGIAAVQTTLGTVLVKLDGVQATLTEIKDDYLVVMLDNQSQMLDNQQQIIIKLDDLSELISQTGESIRLEVRNVGGEILGAIDGAYMDIVGNQQQILDLLDAMNATLVEVSDGVAYIATTVGTIQTDVQDLQTLVADAADSIIMKLDEEVIVAIQQNGETLAQIKASIDALQPVITDIANGVAEIQTTIGTVQTSIDELKQLNMEIKGMVEENGQLLVEINTSVGTIMTTVEALQGLVENQVVTGIENIATELQALGETGQQILAATQAVQEQVAKIDDVQQTLTEVRSDVADVKATVSGLEGTIQQAKDEVIGAVGQQLEQFKQDLQQQTQQASEQAQQASGTAQTWGVINAVLSLAVLAAAGYLILQVRQQSS